MGKEQFLICTYEGLIGTYEGLYELILPAPPSGGVFCVLVTSTPVHKINQIRTQGSPKIPCSFLLCVHSHTFISTSQISQVSPLVLNSIHPSGIFVMIF